MAELIKNYKIWLVFLVILASFLIILFNGLNLGIDFKGGTIFQIHLEERTSPEKIERVARIIEQRLNWTGMKDVKVYTWGNEFVVAQMPETSPEEIQRIEALLKKQGKFEVMLEGKLVFTGEDIIEVDASTSGIPAIQPLENGYARWNLPFVLKSSAAKNFRDLAFHKCEIVSFSQQGKNQYECALTYFFIDRPSKAIIISTTEINAKDLELFKIGNNLEGIPSGTNFDEVKLNAGLPYFVIDSTDESFSEEDLNKLKELTKEKRIAIVPSTLSPKLKQQLTSLGYQLNEKSVQENIPFFWSVSGMKSIVRLEPSITGNDPYVENVADAKIITDLIITGSSQNAELAQKERSMTKILLQSGSLPVAVESITKETISPALGENFLFLVGIIGVIVLIVVSLIIVFRYKQLKLSIAIMFTALVEAFSTLAFTSLFGNLDLSAMTGILAVVGTGVNDQIIITDELLSGEAAQVEGTILTRIKKAFFIIFAAAATIMATMLPILLFGYAMLKLVGFAIATIIGVLIGILITRPAYAEIVQRLIK